MNKLTLKKTAGLLVACAAILGATSGQVQAAPVTITWDDTAPKVITTDIALYDFNNAEIAFTGFSADTLTAVAGNGYFHDHANALGVQVFLDLRVDGIWVPIWTTNSPANNMNEDLTLASEVGTPISFTAGVVDGIRLRSNPGINQTYHSMFGEEFTFNTNATVPEPASLALFGLGSLGMGVIARRRKRKLELAS